MLNDAIFLYITDKIYEKAKNDTPYFKSFNEFVEIVCFLLLYIFFFSTVSVIRRLFNLIMKCWPENYNCLSLEFWLTSLNLSDDFQQNPSLVYKWSIFLNLNVCSGQIYFSSINLLLVAYILISNVLFKILNPKIPNDL